MFNYRFKFWIKYFKKIVLILRFIGDNTED